MADARMADPRRKLGMANGPTGRSVRADARRNEDAVLEAAKHVFAASGVDAPVREIAARARVGVSALYRWFPKRSDLIAAVFRCEIDACVADVQALAVEKPPGEALASVLMRYTQFVATKRGLAAALHSGDPAFDARPVYFRARFEPALQSLLEAASAAGVIRDDVLAYDLLRAIGNLSAATGEDSRDHIGRMVALLIDGLKYGVTALVKDGAG
jgi:AcrR family transcriptional regulator